MAVGGLLDGLPIVPASGWVVVGALALLIILGRFPTPGQYREIRADRDHYRAAADTLQKATLEQGMTLEKLTAATETLLANDQAILHVVQEIQRAGGQT
jgi:hypothetical protein